MPFVLCVILSLLFHLSLIWFSRPGDGKIRLPLRRGEPFEITKSGGTPRASSVRSDLNKPKASDPATSAQSGNNGTGNTQSQGGISDGTEFGISKPPYPEAARLRGEEGKVLLKLSLDKEGALVKVDVLESSGFPDLDRTGLRQVEKDMARSKSGLVEREVPLRFNFVLPKDK